MIRILALALLLLTLKASVFSQELKKQKHRAKYGYAEEYTVLKSDWSVKHGLYELTYNKAVRIKGLYDNNQKVGYWVYFGKFSTLEGKSASIEYYKDGVMIWAKGLIQSKYANYYYDDNQMLDSIVYEFGNFRRSEVYIDDTIKFTKFTNDGSVRISGNLIGDKPVGIWKYKLIGSTAILQFSNGVQKGIQTSFYENGTIHTQYTLNDSGKREGIFWRFFENGDTFIKSQYSNGLMNGKSTVWHKNGQIFINADYRSGRLFNRNVFDEQGNPIKDEFKDGNGTIHIYKMTLSSTGSEVDFENPVIESQLVNGYVHGNYIKYGLNGRQDTIKYLNGLNQNKLAIKKDTLFLDLAKIQTEMTPRDHGLAGSDTMHMPYVQFMQDLIYPRAAQEAGVQGTVVYAMEVNVLGETSKPILVSKPLGYGCEEVVMEIIEASLPFWLPTTLGGMPETEIAFVSISFTLY